MCQGTAAPARLQCCRRAVHMCTPVSHCSATLHLHLCKISVHCRLVDSLTRAFLQSVAAQANQKNTASAASHALVHTVAMQLKQWEPPVFNKNRRQAFYTSTLHATEHLRMTTSSCCPLAQGGNGAGQLARMAHPISRHCASSWWQPRRGWGWGGGGRPHTLGRCSCAAAGHPQQRPLPPPLALLPLSRLSGQQHLRMGQPPAAQAHSCRSSSGNERLRHLLLVCLDA